MKYSVIDRIGCVEINDDFCDSPRFPVNKTRITATFTKVFCHDRAINKTNGGVTLSSVSQGIVKKDAAIG